MDKLLAGRQPERVVTGELVSFPGPWGFQIPRSSVILVRDQDLIDLATDPDLVKSAPHSTPIGRVDDVLAAKHPVLTFRQMKNEE